MSRPPRNGIDSTSNQARRNRGRSIALVGHTRPLGPSPPGRGAAYKYIWKGLKEQLVWINYSHRQLFAEAVELIYESVQLRDFFTMRTAEFVKEGKHPALAMLDDTEKRPHPLYALKTKNGDDLRKVLNSLGATPGSQVRMLSTVTNKVPDVEPATQDYFDA